jgi:hypothetical protein
MRRKDRLGGALAMATLGCAALTPTLYLALRDG